VELNLIRQTVAITMNGGVGQTPGDWNFVQHFGERNIGDDIAESDIVSTVEFDHTGNFLATGDKGGRIVIFEKAKHSKQEEGRGRTDSDTSRKDAEFNFFTEFQSHDPEFDYLKSLEIEEKINQIKWLKPAYHSHFLLSANDKTIKLWKLHAKSVMRMYDTNREAGSPPASSNGQGEIKIPKLQVQDAAITATPKKIYSNAHAYHINSLSPNSDGETYISVDDLRINMWHLDSTDSCFNIVDIKPENMEDLAEVITSATFHPTHCNILMYGSSQGTIKLGDLRASALCDRQSKIFQDTQTSGNTDNSQYLDIVSSISDVKFTADGRYICRETS